MTIDPVAQALHHKSVLGGVLTAEEQERLRKWYAVMDEEEAAMLAKNAPPQRDLTELRAQVAAAAAELVTEAQRIQSLVAANEKLRQEIAAIEQELAGKNLAQPA